MLDGDKHYMCVIPELWTDELPRHFVYGNNSQHIL